MPDDSPARVSDALLLTFMDEQREHNHLSDKRFDSIEDIVIGPVITGSTGAPVLNGDGLPYRDKKRGLAGRRNWVPTVLQLLGLTTAVVILLTAIS